MIFFFGFISIAKFSNSAVGGPKKKVIPNQTGDGYKTVSTIDVTLSCDHRVVDGAVGAQWLKYFKKYLEHPTSMLL